MQNFVYSLLDPFFRGVDRSDRFRAAGLPGGGVVGAILDGFREFLLARGELFGFVDSVENVCFVADCFSFLDC